MRTSQVTVGVILVIFMYWLFSRKNDNPNLTKENPKDDIFQRWSDGSLKRDSRGTPLLKPTLDTSSLATGDQISAISLNYDGPKVFFGVKEVEVYDGNGEYITPDKFVMTQKETLQGYTAENAMNGKSSAWRDGSNTTRSSSTWWKAVLTTPSLISSIKLYFVDEEQPSNTTLTLQKANTEEVIQLENKIQQEIQFANNTEEE